MNKRKIYLIIIIALFAFSIYIIYPIVTNTKYDMQIPVWADYAILGSSELYVIHNDEYGLDELTSLDANTGDIIWELEFYERQGTAKYISQGNEIYQISLEPYKDGIVDRELSKFFIVYYDKDNDIVILKSEDLPGPSCHEYMGKLDRIFAIRGKTGEILWEEGISKISGDDRSNIIGNIVRIDNRICYVEYYSWLIGKEFYDYSTFIIMRDILTGNLLWIQDLNEEGYVYDKLAIDENWVYFDNSSEQHKWNLLSGKDVYSRKTITEVVAQGNGDEIIVDNVYIKDNIKYYSYYSGSIHITAKRIDDEEIVWSNSIQNNVKAYLFSPFVSDSYVYLGYGDTIYIFDIKNGDQMGKVKVPHDICNFAVKNGKLWAMCGHEIYVYLLDKIIQGYSL